MSALPDLSLILPAYNEQARIASTIREAYAYFCSRGLTVEILVAADGTDGTREAAQALCHEIPLLKVLGSPERRGKGHGIRQAVRRATGNVIGFADADNKSPRGRLMAGMLSAAFFPRFFANPGKARKRFSTAVDNRRTHASIPPPVTGITFRQT